MLYLGSPISYPPLIVYAVPVRLRIDGSCESDILLYLSACVFSYALMPFICIESGHERGDVELTVLSDLLVGTYRVLETL